MEENIKKIKLLNKELVAENKIIQEKIIELKKDNDYFKGETERLTKELDSIKYSRSYKILQKINKICGRK